MKIDFWSDLHIDQWWQTTRLHSRDGPRIRHDDGSSLYIDWEWWCRHVGYSARIVLVVGDSSNNIDITLKTIEHAAEVYDWVIFTDGNHEHYNKKPYQDNMQKMQNHNFPLKNVTFLSTENPVHIINDVAFVGCNGWYDWLCYEDKGISREDAREEWKRGMNDYRYIRFDSGMPSTLATEHANILAKTIKNLQSNPDITKIVMMTHTVPFVSLIDWNKDQTWNKLTPSYVNSQMASVLTVDENKKIRYWIYGHTHVRKTTLIDGVTFVNNCRGYPREIDGWSLQQIEV